MQENIYHAVVLFAYFLSHIKRAFQPSALTGDNFLVVRVEYLPLQLRLDVPPAGGADYFILDEIRVVVHDGYALYPPVFKRGEHLFLTCPPEVVVSLSDELPAAQSVEKQHVAPCLVQF